MIPKTKIEWTDYVWNPVWGCKSNCSYCYAHKIAKRFAKNIANKEFGDNKYKYMGIFSKSDYENSLRNFNPTWIQTNYLAAFPKKPSKIFVGSMSDIRWWNNNWIRAVLIKIRKYPQHTFQFLTKVPEIYQQYKFPENCWLGLTIDCQKPLQIDNIRLLKSNKPNNITFVSFEPLIDNPGPYLILKSFCKKNIDWIIIGAETGNRKGKVIPKKEWIQKILDKCRVHNIPIFMKPNLKPYWDRKLIQHFPKERR